VIRGAVLGVSLLLAPTLVGATPADVDALDALLTPVSTLTARFTQTVLGAHLEVLQSGEGQLRIARPGKFRWEMKAPYPQLIVANGERVYVYDEDLEQVQIKPIAEAFDGTPARVLAGETDALAAEFDVSRVESKPETFRLSPRADGAPYRELRLSFDGKVISAIEVMDSLGQLTQVQLFDVHVNQPIDEASFAFDVPAGVDVIGDDRPTP
jgi:outer membrane lipoprotein carrier protein